jgi:hypothetical protein
MRDAMRGRRFGQQMAARRPKPARMCDTERRGHKHKRDTVVTDLLNQNIPLEDAQ